MELSFVTASELPEVMRKFEQHRDNLLSTAERNINELVLAFESKLGRIAEILKKRKEKQAVSEKSAEAPKEKISEEPKEKKPGEAKDRTPEGGQKSDKGRKYKKRKKSEKGKKSEKDKSSEMKSASGEQQPCPLHASLMQPTSNVLTPMYNGPAGTLLVSASLAQSNCNGSSDEDHEHPSRILCPGGNRRIMAQENPPAERSVSEPAEKPVHGSEAASSFPAFVHTGTEICTDVYFSVMSENDPLSACCVQDFSVDNTVSKDSSNVAAHIELEESVTCSNASSDYTEKPDAGILTAEQVEESGGGPGDPLFGWGLRRLKQELSAWRGDFTEERSIEPVVNLCCTGQGMSGNLVTVGDSSSGELEEFQVLADACSAQESPLDAILLDAGYNSSGASNLRKSGAGIRTAL